MELTTKWLYDLIQAKKEGRSVEFCRDTLRSHGWSLTPEDCEDYRSNFQGQIDELSVREKVLKKKLHDLLISFGLTELQISWGIGPELTKRQMKKAEKIYDELAYVLKKEMILMSFVEAVEPVRAFDGDVEQ